MTRLLVSIKQLLEALTLWSTTKMDEGQVSDVYVRLGNDFNAAVAAFAAFNIDMSYVGYLALLTFLPTRRSLTSNAENCSTFRKNYALY